MVTLLVPVLTDMPYQGMPSGDVGWLCDVCAVQTRGKGLQQGLHIISQSPPNNMLMGSLGRMVSQLTLPISAILSSKGALY